MPGSSRVLFSFLPSIDDDAQDSGSQDQPNGRKFLFRDPLVTHFSQNQAKDHEKCLEHLLGLLLLTEAMLESHIEAGRQHNTRYAGFHPSEKALDIPVVQQVMEQRRDQEDDKERR